MEMKHLFFFAPKDEKGGEVTKVFLAEKQVSNAALRSIKHWRQCLVATLRRRAVGELASDALVKW
jgi:hypothetical protein